jgi:alpha-beta hydrolase superfamily lysophospholipase
MIERQLVSLPSPTANRNGAGFMPAQGIYYVASGTKPRTAIIASHYNVDFSEHYMADLMAERGFGFLGWNTRFRGAEPRFALDHALSDIGVGVRWLREVAGVDKVVLLGNSGGGSLLAAYQSQAVEPNLAPLLGRAPAEAASELLPGDLYVSSIAHPGRPEVLTTWIDPSVVDESDPLSVDPSLDMFNPENGPPYSQEFVDRYRAAQVARNDRITDWALKEMDRLQEGGAYDRNFNMHRCWADLRFLDANLDPSDREIGLCYAGEPKFANYGPFGLGANNTVRSWLSMWSLKESQCRGDSHLARITVPSLVVQSTADTGVFPSDAQTIYDSLAAKDRTLEFVPGDHYLQAPDDARDNTATLIADWLNRH